MRRHRVRNRQGLDRGDEPVTSPRDGLNIRGLGRIVAERLAEFRDGLRQCIVGHRHIGPQRGEQFVLANERRLPGDEIEQQIDNFRGERDDLSAAQQTVRAGVDGEWAEAIRRNHCHWSR